MLRPWPVATTGAITSFLGFDEATGRLIHLHVHFRLMLGEPLLKNYHAPWEQELLARAVFHPSFPIRMLDPVSEAFLLTVRMSLEMSRFDPVAVRQRQATLRKFKLDQDELGKRVNREDLRDLSALLLGEDAADLPGDILFDVGRAHSAKRGLKKNLAPFRTYNSLEMRVRALSRAFSWAAGHLNKRVLHLPRPWSCRAPGGGRVISIIGVDGSGKSTAVSTIKNWLGDEMDVMPVYLGTGNGRASLLLLPLKLMVPLATKLVGPRPKEASDGKVSGRRRGLLYTTLLTGWATVVAIEKRGKLLSAHRGADRGLLSFDRPLPAERDPGFQRGANACAFEQRAGVAAPVRGECLRARASPAAGLGGEAYCIAGNCGTA